MSQQVISNLNDLYFVYFWTVKRDCSLENITVFFKHRRVKYIMMYISALLDPVPFHLA